MCQEIGSRGKSKMDNCSVFSVEVNLPVRSVDVAMVLLSLTLSVVPIQVELDPANNPLPPQVAFKVGEFLFELSPFLPPPSRDI